MKKKCWIIGAGYMATEYIKVLKKFDVELVVIGRGSFRSKLINDTFKLKVYSGGLENIELTNEKIPEFAIVAVSKDELINTINKLIKIGIKNILLEKPGALNIEELTNLTDFAIQKQSNVYIAYNRRFYSSIKYLKEKIIDDGGISSINFEFTEWIDDIDTNKYPISVLERFLICNSTHVIDTVFHLAGTPKYINAEVGNKNEIKWHPAGSLFMGFGITEKNINFSYSSNWSAPGRWAIEILTKNNRYYLKPLEQLFIQKKGSVNIDLYSADYSIDLDFKPGLFMMVKAFLEKDNTVLCSLDEHKKNFIYYQKIGGY